MGLDIRVFRGLTPAPDVTEEEAERDWKRYCRFDVSTEWSESEWPGRAAGLELNVTYRFVETFSFRAGSYSGYNDWRSWLARVAGFKGSEDYWASAKPDAPFYELINFADNEGTIGPVVAKELARDFAENEARAEAMNEFDEFDEWAMEKYRTWRRAFEAAADGGAVDFH